MPTITEGRLEFTFPNHWKVAKYEDWAFYRKQFQKVADSKAVDIVALEPDKNTWLIEVKDYRIHQRTKVVEIADEIALKARDTLAGLAAAQCNANDQAEQNLADLALRAPKLKVILHLEQPQMHSKLFPRTIDPAKVLQALKQKIKAIDAHPKIYDCQMTGYAWSVK